MNTEVQEEKKVKFCDKSAEGNIITFAFGDGENITLDVSELDEEVQRGAMIHGILQKGGDSYAGAAGDYAFAKAALRKVLDNLLAGNWKAERAAGEGKPKTGELALAIAELKGIEVAQAQTAIEAMTEEQVKGVRAHPVVKAKIAELRARKAQEAAAKSNQALTF